MKVTDLTEIQREKLNEAIAEAMVAAAAIVLTDAAIQARIQHYRFMYPDSNAHDMLKYGLGDFTNTFMTYRPFEFEEFLNTLEF